MTNLIKGVRSVYGLTIQGSGVNAAYQMEVEGQDVVPKCQRNPLLDVTTGQPLKGQMKKAMTGQHPILKIADKTGSQNSAMIAFDKG